MLIKVNESTAARRRVPVVLVDGTDGVTAETGITLSSGDLKISKNGGAEANHAGSLVELTAGDYYYELSAGEVDTLGYLTGRLIKAGVRTYRFKCQVVAFDPYDAVRQGLSALPNAAANAPGGLPVSAGGSLALDTLLGRLDVAVSTRLAGASYTAPLDAAGIRSALGMSTSNLPNEAADALLARNIAGGSSSGRTVGQAIAFLRNRWVSSAGVLTVYGTDDSTVLWTATLTQSPGNPVSSMDPA